MAAGARRWRRREKGSRARQRNSSLLESARQLQALVRQRLGAALLRHQRLDHEPYAANLAVAFASRQDAGLARRPTRNPPRRGIDASHHVVLDLSRDDIGETLR